MDSRASFVVEVRGPVRERRDVTVERVADALGLDELKAGALVGRMPGVITRPLPEARAAKVALRLQAAGVTAFHRRATPAELGMPSSADGPEAERGAAIAEARAPAPEPDAGRGAAREGWAGAGAEAEPAFAVDDDTRSPLAGVPSVDATLVDEPYRDPKLTPMTEAGFGAADVVVPTEPHPRFPTPPAASAEAFAAPIVEGGATAHPGEHAHGTRDADDDRGVHDPGARESGAGEVRASDHGASDHGGPDHGARAPRRGGEGARRYARSNRDTPPRERSAGVGAVAPSARARDAIARDRATDGGLRDRTPVPAGEDELRLEPDVVYRSTRTSADQPITVAPPPDDLLKKTGVREDALSTARLRRRGSFGRRIASLVMLPAALGWVLTSGFLWLLLPQPQRVDLWVPLAAAAAVAALFAALAAGLATGRIAHDVTALRDAAERVAMGDLSHPVEVRRNDELGDLAASVDRMRVSLQESLDRLRRRRG